MSNKILKPTVSDDLKAGLQRMESVVSSEVVRELEGYRLLTINGIDDKEGFKAVDRARITVKNQRVAVERVRKELGEEALRYKQAVDKTANRIKNEIIAPVEEHLKAEIGAVKEQIARIEKARKIAEEIEFCIDLAYEMNETFDKQVIEALRLEAQRIEQERIAEELQKEQEQIARKEREEHIRKKAEAKVRREMEAHAELLERQRQQAEARAQQERIAKSLDDELERLRLEEAERQRISNLPNIEKVRNYINSLAGVSVPAIESDSIARKDLDLILNLLHTLSSKYNKVD